MPNPTPQPAPVDRTSTQDWAPLIRALLVYARRLGAPIEEAEDLAHDAIEVLMQDPHWYDPSRGPLGAALRTILRNRYLNRVRSQGTFQRSVPTLRVVEAPFTPHAALTADQARRNRHAFLSMLQPDERRLFQAWMRQKSGALRGPAAAESVHLTPAAYEAAKKRLRRRCQTVLDELNLTQTDLYDPPSMRGVK